MSELQTIRNIARQVRLKEKEEIATMTREERFWILKVELDKSLRPEFKAMVGRMDVSGKATVTALIKFAIENPKFTNDLVRNGGRGIQVNS